MSKKNMKKTGHNSCQKSYCFKRSSKVEMSKKNMKKNGQNSCQNIIALKGLQMLNVEKEYEKE